MSDCELPRLNATSDEIRDILKTAKRIAVVGHSDNPARDSYHVGRYLAKQGYQVFPVNPNGRPTHDLKFYPDLESIPGPIDVVDIFRRPDAIPDIVDEAIKLRAKVIWMQEGLVDNVAADRARQAGLRVVMNRCILKEHRALSFD
jgi:uncharacterized protein